MAFKQLRPILLLLLGIFCDVSVTAGNVRTAASRNQARRAMETTGTVHHDSIRSTRLMNGDSSSIYDLPTLDVSEFDDLRVRFSFRTSEMQAGNSFKLQYSSNNGGEWTNVATYVRGSNDIANQSFVNDREYMIDLILGTTSETFTFEHQSRFRFVCENCGGGSSTYVDIANFALQGLVDLEISTKRDEISTSNPTSAPTNAPTSNPTSTPTDAPTSNPTSTPTDAPTPTTWDSVCPIRRQNPPTKYEIQIFSDSIPHPTDEVEDDLSEMSYIAFSEQRDANGKRYAYTASDKEQFSLKVLQFNDYAGEDHFAGEGVVVAVYTLDLPPPLNDDWEDISLGPCTDTDEGSMYSTDQTCIYIANTGNNKRPNKPQREVLSVYKFVEPVISSQGPVDQLVPVATIKFIYASGFAPKIYDSEAMFVDWTGDEGVIGDNAGDVYVVTKGGCSAGVGKIPVSVHKNLAAGTTSTNFEMASVVDEPPQQLSITCHDGPFRVWTGADMRRDGRLISLVRTGAPAAVYFFPRLAGESIAEALSRRSCDYVSSTSRGLPNENKHEAVAFVGHDRFIDLSECDGGRDCLAPIYFHNLVFPGTANVATVVEPVIGWQTITHDVFGADDWGSFESGGKFSKLSNASDTSGGDTCNGSCACGGPWAVELAVDQGPKSSFLHSANKDLRVYDAVRVTFQYKSRSYDHLDSLYLELSLDGGLSYHILETWAHEVDGFVNGVCYTGKVVMTREQLRVSSFGTQVRLRFRNGGNAGNDRIYVNDVKFEGHVA